MRQSWQQAKAELVDYAHRAYDRGLVAGTGGNISVRTGDGSMLITASGLSLAQAGPDSLITVDLNTLEWRAKAGLLPSREYVYHAQILRLRDGVDCVMHVHPPYTTTFAALHRDVPMMTDAGYRLPEIKRVPFHPSGSAKLQEEIIGYVRSYPAVPAFLIEGHGLTTMGATPHEAYHLADLIESVAQVAYQVEVLRKAEEPQDK